MGRELTFSTLKRQVEQGGAKRACSTCSTTYPPKGGCKVGGADGAARRVPAGGAILELADRVRRLAPSPRNPDRFHEDKSEIVFELEQLAQQVRRG